MAYVGTRAHCARPPSANRKLTPVSCCSPGRRPRASRRRRCRGGAARRASTYGNTSTTVDQYRSIDRGALSHLELLPFCPVGEDLVSRRKATERNIISCGGAEIRRRGARRRTAWHVGAWRSRGLARRGGKIMRPAWWVPAATGRRIPVCSAPAPRGPQACRCVRARPAHQMRSQAQAARLLWQHEEREFSNAHLPVCPRLSQLPCRTDLPSLSLEVRRQNPVSL
jgi:hypothetical protein